MRVSRKVFLVILAALVVLDTASTAPRPLSLLGVAAGTAALLGVSLGLLWLPAAIWHLSRRDKNDA